MKLAKTIRSTFDPSITYGLQGDTVKIISRHGNVLIVEGDKGRFSVVQEDLTIELIERPVEIIQEKEPKKVAVAAAKKKHQLQTQLF